MIDLKTQVNKEFLDLFTHDIKDYQFVKEKVRLNLHILRIDSNKFTYEDLIPKLSNALNTYCMSRTKYHALCKDEKYGELHREAIRRLRTYKSNLGEAGEILLYCFLETHLNAPKILTKLELKMSSDDYVKGSDGVHLLEVATNNYQLIFGESKLDKELTTSLSEAFKSINDFIHREKNNIYDEINLISGELLKETVDKELYKYLLNIIKPTATGGITKNNAFGIFAGFDLRVTEEDMKLGNVEFANMIRQMVVKEVESKYEHIRKKINEYKLWGYHFYVYAFPFIGKTQAVKKIIKSLEEPSGND